MRPDQLMKEDIPCAQRVCFTLRKWSALKIVAEPEQNITCTGVQVQVPLSEPVYFVMNYAPLVKFHLSFAIKILTLIFIPIT